MMLDTINTRLQFVFTQPKIFIPILIILSLIIRLYYTPFELPLASDAFLYFSYAIDIATLGGFPDHLVGNDGWATFLSLFFMILPSNEFIDFMNAQRLLSITLSCLTIIPVYLLCRKFFNIPYSLFGAAIFALEPRLIQNSLFGLTEPLYILLGTTSIALLLYFEKKYYYLSFFIVGLATISRIEGIFLFFTITIIFFIKNKFKKITTYVVGIIIFVSTWGMMILTRINIAGKDYSTYVIEKSTENLIQSSIKDDSSFITDGLINLIKFLGWDLIPIFILFVPIGFIIIVKSKNINKMIILIPILVMIFPAFYAYSAKAFDTRYLFILYPFFSVISLYSIELFLNKVKKKNLILLFLIIGLVIISISFIEYNKIDVEHEKEAISLIYEIEKRVKVANEYWPESQYTVIIPLSNLEKFPTLSSEFDYKHKLLNEKKNNLQEYLEYGRSEGLTHLIVDDKEHFQYRMEFLKDIFMHEDKYPYLMKVFDSKDFGYNYRLKIFEVNYNEFDRYE